MTTTAQDTRVLYSPREVFGVTEQTHRDCLACLEQAHSAVITALSTGSHTAAATRIGSPGQTHSARVIRLHAVIDCDDWS